ncbi:deoxyribose-phosphate aldolase DeoC [Clostridium aceticum]|uniref:Deoxyribose-phosphate aldolase n=1 Tax=Clostridium aceticum TaxID=84022 RepID=A0A0D8I673_9CLOT|nr:deoxyribose-phosphate aldolase [Clostridium aceticum]AKL93753.1 deoxyribose-phosphate aldolase DeoC [Clostridium aceticum]KJF25795.1 deoxyribose-phosphate aldolase [Clostridium aceticum]
MISNKIKEKVAGMIDHTILKPEATKEEIIQLCDEAKRYNFASVCIHPHFVPLAYDLLKDTDVKVCTVIGFPLGLNTTEVKRYETKKAIEAGATEVDMVINVGQLKDKNYEFVLKDIKAVVDEAKVKAIVKVIIETCILTKEEKVKACKICVDAGADFVKTSTGFNKGGATKEDIELMSSIVHPKLKVKASGGIRSAADAVMMIEAGADRIGTSSGVKILNEA